MKGVIKSTLIKANFKLKEFNDFQDLQSKSY